MRDNLTRLDQVIVCAATIVIGLGLTLIAVGVTGLAAA